MRQVFYIDVDEEIISVVDRLRRSQAEENVFVFPQGAFVLRSIVNLKLFDREAKKRGKVVSIVTTDAIGKTFAEKIGIPVSSHLDPREDSQTILQTLQEESHMLEPQEENNVPAQSQQGAPKKIVASLGSQDFFGTQPPVFNASDPTFETGNSVPLFGQSVRSETPEPAALVSAARRVVSSDGVRRVPVTDRTPKHLTALNSTIYAESLQNDPPQNLVPSAVPQNHFAPLETKPENLSARPMFVASSVRGQTSTFAEPSQTQIPHAHLGSLEKHLRLAQPLVADSDHSSLQQEKTKLGSFFSGTQKAEFSNEHHITQEPIHLNQSLPNTTHHSTQSPTGMRYWKWLLGFLLLGGVFGGAAWAFLFISRADIVLSIKTVQAESDMHFLVGASDLSGTDQVQQLQTQLIETQQEITQTFKATGSASLSDKRARGTVLIANSYGTDPQTLVATTRLLSTNGKLFRLKETIVVPGMKQSSGAIIPGTIEAEVVADQPGAEYNLEPTAFSIPGLEGTPKKEKFSVKSTRKFYGGGTDGAALATITSSDVLEAKKTVDAAARKAVEDDLRSKLSEGEQLLPEAIEMTIVSSAASPSTGVAVEDFEYHTVIHARTLAFSESDVRKMIAESIRSQENGQKAAIDVGKITLEYGQPTIDFEKNTLRFQAHATTVIAPPIIADSLKQEFLGKGEKDMSLLLEQHPEISNIEVQFGKFPFWNKVPSRSQQVSLKLKYDDPIVIPETGN